jgi:ribonuclease VapC
MGSVTFVDTSAVVAILMAEGDAPALSARLKQSELCMTSAAVRLEACMVIAARRAISPDRAQDYFDALSSEAGVTEIPIDERIGRLAVQCFSRFGKGRHPAQLNFGDCLSYACAKAHEAYLLFKGDDFSKTDVNDHAA